MTATWLLLNFALPLALGCAPDQRPTDCAAEPLFVFYDLYPLCIDPAFLMPVKGLNCSHNEHPECTVIVMLPTHKTADITLFHQSRDVVLRTLARLPCD